MDKPSDAKRKPDRKNAATDKSEVDATRPSAEAQPIGPTSAREAGRPEDTRKGTDPQDES